MSLLLGCIADDYTGGTDLAGALVRNGMRTVQTVSGVPDAAWLKRLDAEAIVVALKTRTVAPAEAVAESVAALEALRAAGCQQFFFKYCSTFDSTMRGNIGPVADALADALGAGTVPFCPAFPANGRAVFKGYLFAGEVLLNESGMQDHPLTPMTDPNLCRVLAAQSRHGVGLVRHDVVERGVDALRSAFDEAAASVRPFVIVDAINDDHLRVIGAACRDLVLVTGGSGVAIGLPQNFRHLNLLAEARADVLDPPRGAAAVVSGSCSRATLAQVQAVPASRRFPVDAKALLAGDEVAEAALAYAEDRLGDAPVLIYSSAPPEEVAQVQQSAGALAVGAMIEQCLATVAAGLVERGVGRLVVAGGETAGAVVQALGVKALRIGADIDPGVPWTQGLDGDGRPFIHLALKSGNFGAEDFFNKAFAVLSGD